MYKERKRRKENMALEKKFCSDAFLRLALKIIYNIHALFYAWSWVKSCGIKHFFILKHRGKKVFKNESIFVNFLCSVVFGHAEHDTDHRSARGGASPLTHARTDLKLRGGPRTHGLKIEGDHALTDPKLRGTTHRPR